MDKKNIKQLLYLQRTYFESGETQKTESRIRALKKLRANIQACEDEICHALYQDLGKSRSESYMTEIGMAYAELDYMLKHIRKFAAKKQMRTPLAQAVSKSYVLPVPKGCVLIMSPWNYPFLLTIEPLIDAIAAGNTVILKPSAYAPATVKVLKKIIRRSFPVNYAAVVTGGREENQELLNMKFDHIFFTGSQAVGKEVLKKAADHFTPVTLELGGKSPCIIDPTADLQIAARRIVFGKFLNCGQTCVAPDYIFCHEAVAEDFVRELVREIRRQLGEDPLTNQDYGRIINEKHFHRLEKLLEENTVYKGGKTDPEQNRIEPAVLWPCKKSDTIMDQEIFGPLLPVLPYRSLKKTLEFINKRPHPLAFYIFSKDKKVIRQIERTCPFGGGCINDTIIHLASSDMPFGGFGASGMGAYHGKAGFDTFSHYKSMVNKKTWPDLPMRYQPYNEKNDKLIRMFLR